MIRQIEIGTASLTELDMMCAMYLGHNISNTSYMYTGVLKKVSASRTEINRTKSKCITNMTTWYSPTRKWADAGEIMERYLTETSMPRGSWPLSEIIRHILMNEYGDFLEIP